LRSHLNSNEIERILLGGDEPDKQAAESDAFEHFKACESCQMLVRAHREAAEELARLQIRSSGTRSFDCPPESVLMDLAAGISVKDSEIYLNHAAQCEHCGPLLREATADLAGELSVEDDQRMEQLRTASPEWQRGFAQRLSQAAQSSDAAPRWTSIFTLPRLALAGALASIVAFGAWWTLGLSSSQSAIQLLAQAYSEQRSFELRIPAAHYSPWRASRGIGKSQFSRPVQLLEAETLITKQLPRHPNDGGWLAAKGRANLLAGEYDDAIENLKNALVALPGSVPIQIDLATATSERGETKNQPWDNAEAAELLKSVLKQEPQNTVALFNLAIVLERQRLYHEAVGSWQHYLGLDSTGPWSDEARTHLRNDEQEIHDSTAAEPLLNPPALDVALRQNKGVATHSVDQRLEEYQQEAAIHWLPCAFSPTSPENERKECLSGLQLIAELTRAGHHDAWLSDLLEQVHNPIASKAVLDLSAALNANDVGDYAKGALKARIAARGFEAAHSRAGYLRAAVEQVYSARLSHDALTCQRLAQALPGELSNRRYAWAYVQASLELQECLNMLGQLENSRLLSSNTLAGAKKSGYPVLYLRALFFAADVEASLGNLKEAWRLTRQGLSLSWGKGMPPMRIYSFETELDILASQSGLPNFDSMVLADAVETIKKDPDILLRAMAHGRLAEANLSVGDDTTAEEQFRIAMTLFSSAPRTAVTTNHWMETRIGMAQAEEHQLRFASAVKELEAISQDILTVSNRFLLIDYCRALGRAKLELGDLSGATTALAAALHLTEPALGSLRSDKDRTEWDHISSGLYRDIVEVKLRQHDETGALEIWEWYRAAAIRFEGPADTPRLYVGMRSTNIFDNPILPQPEEVRHRLESLTHETIVSFAFLHGGLAAWTYDNRGVRFHWTSVDAENVSFLATRFSELCADPLSDRKTLMLLGRRLYDTLLGGFASTLSSDRVLIFEPDGPLWALPMQALTSPEGTYLADTFTISEFPGLYYTTVLPPAHVFRGDESALVIASADSTSFDGVGLPEIPNVLAEARSVASSFHRSVMLSGGVTLPTLRRDLPRVQLFHFAGHAIALPDGVALLISSRHTGSPDIVISASTISRMPMGALRLVVLSGCSTESRADGEGLLDAGSLARVFLRGGVPEVVASRWMVDSVTTELFMRAFYEALLADKTVPAALRVAMLQIRSQAHDSHPYYWAAFGAFGWA
jgi:CHAT domain-containing protein/tetratricopeptide (TPR) repeat protein